MSKIEWTERTWNPIVGCSVVSPGCTNCYAMRMAHRHAMMSAAQNRVSPYAGLTRIVNGKAVWTGELRLVESALTLPLRTRKPTTWFVNSMSDLSHEDVPDEWIDRVFAVMALAPQHTFQVLTKRSARMRTYLSDPAVRDRVQAQCHVIGIEITGRRMRHAAAEEAEEFVALSTALWPLPNVWLGVSAEDQRRADERVPDLLATPAAVRFVSAEPLLGPIDFRPWLSDDDGCESCDSDGCDCPTSKAVWVDGAYDEHRPETCWTKRVTLSWIILGDESGPSRRPVDLDHVRDILRQCEAPGTPVFLKQLHIDGRKVSLPKLDGVEHNGMPSPTPIGPLLSERGEL